MKVVVYANDDLTKTEAGINYHSAQTILNAFDSNSDDVFLFHNQDIVYNPNGSVNSINLRSYERDKPLIKKGNSQFDIASNVSIDDMEILFCKREMPPQEALNYLSDVFEKNDKPMINGSNMYQTFTKEYCSQFSDFTPYTNIESDIDSVVDSIKNLGSAIIKPMNEGKGRGITKVHYSDSTLFINDIPKNESKLRSVLDGLQSTYGIDDSRLIVQEFIPEVVEGDKRILVMASDGYLDYQPISLRTPKQGSFLCNFHQGGHRKPLPDMTAKEREIIESLAPQLVKDKVFMSGFDIIAGKYLTEINTINPGFMLNDQQINQINLEQRIIDFAKSFK